jgi:hypothetical protein
MRLGIAAPKVAVLGATAQPKEDIVRRIRSNGFTIPLWHGMGPRGGGREKGVETGREGIGYTPRRSIDVEHVILLHAELEEAARNLRDTGFELEVGDVLVFGKVEVLPGLGLLDLLAPDHLRDLLLLLDNVDNITDTICVALSMHAAGVEENVVDSVDALHWAGDESVLGLL